MASQFPPKKNSPFTLYFTLYKSDGTVVANPGTITKKVSIDGGDIADIAAAVTEENTTYGQLSLVIASGEMNGDSIWVYITDDTVGTVPFTITLNTSSSTFDEVMTAVAGIDSTVLKASNYIAPDNAGITTIKAKTDGLNFTGTDVKATLDGEEVIPTLASKTGYTVSTVQDKTGYSGIATNMVNAPLTAEETNTSVWGSGNRTLSGFGTLVNDIATAVWAFAGRTLSAFGFNVTVGTNNDKTGYTLTAADKTAIANEVEAQIIDDTDTERVLQAIVDKIAAANPSLDDLTLGAIASAVRTEISVELARIDASISSRLASSGYTAPLDAAGTQSAAFDAITTYNPPTKAELDTAVGLVTAKTDQLVFTTPGKVDSVATVDFDEAAVAAEIAPLLPAPQVTVNPTPVTVDTDESALAAALAPLIPAPDVTVNPTPVTVNTDEPALASAIAALIPAPEVTINPTPVTVDTDEAALAAAVAALIPAPLFAGSVGLSPEDVQSLIDAINAAIGDDLETAVAAEIITKMLEMLSVSTGLSIGPGIGSVRYEDIITGRNNIPIAGAIIRAYPHLAGFTDYADCKGSCTANGAGEYHLNLDPGVYAIRVWKNGIVVLDDLLTVS